MRDCCLCNIINIHTISNPFLSWSLSHTLDTPLVFNLPNMYQQHYISISFRNRASFPYTHTQIHAKDKPKNRFSIRRNNIYAHTRRLMCINVCRFMQFAYGLFVSNVSKGLAILKRHIHAHSDDDNIHRTIFLSRIKQNTLSAFHKHYGVFWWLLWTGQERMGTRENSFSLVPIKCFPCFSKQTRILNYVKKLRCTFYTFELKRTNWSIENFTVDAMLFVYKQKLIQKTFMQRSKPRQTIAHTKQPMHLQNLTTKSTFFYKLQY